MTNANTLDLDLSNSSLDGRDVYMMAVDVDGEALASFMRFMREAARRARAFNTSNILGLALDMHADGRERIHVAAQVCHAWNVWAMERPAR